MNCAAFIRPSLISRSPKNSSAATNNTPMNSMIAGDIPAMLAERRFARRMSIGHPRESFLFARFRLDRPSRCFGWRVLPAPCPSRCLVPSNDSRARFRSEVPNRIVNHGDRRRNQKRPEGQSPVVVERGDQKSDQRKSFAQHIAQSMRDGRFNRRRAGIKRETR